MTVTYIWTGHISDKSLHKKTSKWRHYLNIHTAGVIDLGEIKWRLFPGFSVFLCPSLLLFPSPVSVTLDICFNHRVAENSHKYVSLIMHRNISTPRWSGVKTDCLRRGRFKRRPCQTKDVCLHKGVELLRNTLLTSDQHLILVGLKIES